MNIYKMIVAGIWKSPTTGKSYDTDHIFVIRASSLSVASRIADRLARRKPIASPKLKSAELIGLLCN